MRFFVFLDFADIKKILLIELVLNMTKITSIGEYNTSMGKSFIYQNQRKRGVCHALSFVLYKKY